MHLASKLPFGCEIEPFRGSYKKMQASKWRELTYKKITDRNNEI